MVSTRCSGGESKNPSRSPKRSFTGVRALLADRMAGKEQGELVKMERACPLTKGENSDICLPCPRVMKIPQQTIRWKFCGRNTRLNSPPCKRRKRTRLTVPLLRRRPRKWERLPSPLLTRASKCGASTIRLMEPTPLEEAGDSADLTEHWNARLRIIDCDTIREGRR